MTDYLIAESDLVVLDELQKRLTGLERAALVGIIRRAQERPAAEPSPQED